LSSISVFAVVQYLLLATRRIIIRKTNYLNDKFCIRFSIKIFSQVSVMFLFSVLIFIFYLSTLN